MAGMEMINGLLDYGDPDPNSTQITFSSLSLSQWCSTTLSSLFIRCPTVIQRCCIPRILAGDDVLAIAATGSGKTATFALPIIAKLAEDPYGIFALVITPTRELGVQLIEQFRAFGVGLNMRCYLDLGGMGMAVQAKGLLERPHVVVATSGRIRFLMEDLDIAKAFSKMKVYKARRVARLKMSDDGYEEKAEARKKLKKRRRESANELDN